MMRSSVPALPFFSHVGSVVLASVCALPNALASAAVSRTGTLSAGASALADDRKSAHPAVTLSPLSYGPQKEAFTPFAPGETIGVRTSTRGGISFDGGFTIARVACEPGERVDFVVPRGAALFFPGGSGGSAKAVSPHLSFGDGSGVFAEAEPRATSDGWLAEPPFGSQRHALLSCPAKAREVAVRLVLRTGVTAPTTGLFPVAPRDAKTEALRDPAAFTWQTFAPLKENATIHFPVVPGTRYLVRVRGVFTPTQLTTGLARFALVAGKAVADVASSLDPADPSIRLANGDTPGSENSILAEVPVGISTLALSCTLDCLLRVERVPDTRDNDRALADAKLRAAEERSLAVRTLSPRNGSGELSVRAVVARVSEPVSPREQKLDPDLFAGFDGGVDTVRGADLFVRPFESRASVPGVLSFDVPRQRPRFVRLTLADAALEADTTRPADRTLDVSLVGARTRHVRVVLNSSLTLPEKMRRGFALDAFADAETPEGSGAGFAWNPRLVLPVTQDVTRIEVTASDKKRLPFLSVSAAFQTATARPISAAQVFEARLSVMARHFKAGAKASSFARVAALEKQGVPAEMRDVFTLERNLSAAATAVTARPLLESRDGLLRSSSLGPLARSVLWETAFTHDRIEVACEAARVLATVSSLRGDDREAALASFHAHARCGLRADLVAVRTALLRGGSLGAAQEFDAVLGATSETGVARLAKNAALRARSAKAETLLRSHPAFDGGAVVEIPVTEAVSRVSGFLVSENKETGGEETRILASQNTPAQISLARGKTYVVTWRRLVTSASSAATSRNEAWLALQGEGGFQKRFALAQCLEPDAALGDALCPGGEGAFFIPLAPAGVPQTPLSITLQPSVGALAFGLRERVSRATEGTSLLTSREKEIAAFESLVFSKENAPAREAARLVADGDARASTSAFRADLALLHARLLRGNVWIPVTANVLHAGTWREDGVSSRWPVDAKDRVEQAYLHLKGNLGSEGERAFLLGGTRRFAFRGAGEKNLSLRLRAVSDTLLPLEPQRVLILKNGASVRTVALAGGDKSLARIAVPLSSPSDVVAVELQDAVAGQSVLLSLPTASEEWRLPDERTWFVSTRSQPLRAYVQGPARARVEERDAQGIVRTRMLTVPAGWNPVTLTPVGGKRSYVRLAVLTTSPDAVVSRPREEPFTLGTLAVLAPARSEAQAALASNSTMPTSQGPARLSAGETRGAAWQVFSQAETRETLDDGSVADGDGRQAATLGTRRKQFLQGLSLYSSSEASLVGVRGREGVVGLGQRFTFAPTPRFFRYVLSGEGFFQRPGGERSRTEWNAIARNELEFPLGFGDGLLVTPHVGFQYRWSSLDAASDRARYAPGAVDTLIDDGAWRANPYGVTFGARTVVAPVSGLAARVVFDVLSRSGVGGNPMDPARLSSSLRYVQLVSDFDVEGFGEIDRVDESNDALKSTKDTRTSVRAGAALGYTHHRGASRLLTFSVRAGQDFGLESPFAAANVVWFLTPDALLLHEAPQDLLMRDERLRRMGAPVSATAVAGLSQDTQP